MDDVIYRQAAIDAIGKKSDEIYKTKQKGATYPHDDFFQGMAYAESVVKQLPSAQPERKTGRWIDDNCSECGQYVFHGDVRNFCPNCGADMRGEDK